MEGLGDEASKGIREMKAVRERTAVCVWVVISVLVQKFSFIIFFSARKGPNKAMRRAGAVQ